MKTDELLGYDRMYAAMRQALDTPWLVFDFPEAEAAREGRGLGLVKPWVQKTSSPRRKAADRGSLGCSKNRSASATSMIRPRSNIATRSARRRA